MRALDIIDADQRQLALRLLGFFDQPRDDAMFCLRHAKATRIFNLFHSKHGVIRIDQRPKIDVKNCVAEDDQNRILRYGVPGKVNRMAESQPFFLLDKIEFDGVVLENVLFDLLAEVSDDDRGLVESVLDDSIENVPHDRLSADVQEHLGERIGMRSQAAPNSCNWNNCSHRRSGTKNKAPR